jgi:hypothetical protein
MVPLTIQVPASVVLLAGGALACFSGYKLFRLVLGVYGFILGALIGTSLIGAGAGGWTVILAAVVGGLLGALVLVAGYVIGVALIGAGLGAIILHVLWKPFGGEPTTLALIIAAAVGGFAAMAFQRYVIIIGTSFGGAWTMLVGAAALMLGKGNRMASAAGDMWVVYPNSHGPDRTWVFIAWIVISLVGMYVQLHTGGKKRSKK